MMENTRPEEEETVKDIGNLFRLKKELNYTAIKDIRNLFRCKKETKVINNRTFKIYWEILKSFLNIKKKIIINRQTK